jgi:membrane fusion protein
MLFRKEALAGQQQAWLGSIQLLRPLSLKLLTAVAVGSVVLIVAFLCTAQYTRKARVSGYLVPDRGVLRITSPQVATVLARQVSEGQSVKAGDVLFVLSLDAASNAGEGVAQSLAQREASLNEASAQRRRLVRQQDESLRARIATLRRESAAAETEAQAYQERLRLLREDLVKHESLRQQGFYSDALLQNKRQELLLAQAQAQTLARERESLQRDLLALQAEAQELPLRAEVQQGEIARDLASLKALGLETEAKRRLVLRAPSDGIVATIQAEPGQPVTPALALASVLPAQTQMLAHLYAPSSAVGFVRPEQGVQLRYQAFPYQKFGHQYGRVLQVSRTPLPASELTSLALPLAQASGGEPLYRITVALQRQSVPAYGEEQPLAVGMQLDADVLLERRRLIEWIFEPLLSLARRV